MRRPAPITPNPVHAFKRLLNDREIDRAIRDGLIVLDNPDVYLTERLTDLIQPGSMDVLLLREEETNPTLARFYKNARGRRKRERSEDERHPEVDQDFITIWPEHETEVAVMHLQDWSFDILTTEIELRSTLRRAGLDIGFNPFGLGRQGRDDYCFFNIRNPQSYPVSIQKGTKIAQILWFDKRLQPKYDIVYEEGGANPLYDVSPVKIGSGIPICNNSGLLKLIKSRDLQISPRATLESGLVVFHAGKTGTYNEQKHIILRKDGRHSGISTRQEERESFKILPGQFVDIATEEKIKLSGRVGMHVYYSFYEPEEVVENWNSADSINSFSTKMSSGGWIDPGYGSTTQNGAAFSVQRKAFTRQIRINEGDPVAVGIVYYFPKGVGQGYGKERGSHYDGAENFLSPK